MDNCDNTPIQGVKVPYDPGWNDPPNLMYNAQQMTPNRPRNFLNKRIAFPLSSSSTSPVPTPPVNLTPVPALVPSALPITAIPQKMEEEIDMNCEETLVEVKGILLNFLESSSELGAKANDIKRRIGVMEDMWSSGKLNKRVQLQMKELAIALKEDNPSAADDLHRALMVDHVGAVGTWMPGVKQLIHHHIARSELLSIDKED